MKVLNVPLDPEEVKKLRLGDVVYLTGEIFTARDMAHLRIKTYLEEGKDLPIDLKNKVIFHAGPVVKEVDGQKVLSVIGPTTSIRMEPYADMLGKLGVKAIIGKGGMAEDTKRCCKEYGYVYLQAAPGCAVKLGKGVEKINGVVWEELAMPEAIWKLQAKEFGPLVVAMDTTGESIYSNLKENALKELEK